MSRTSKVNVVVNRYIIESYGKKGRNSRSLLLGNHYREIYCGYLIKMTKKKARVFKIRYNPIVNHYTIPPYKIIDDASRSKCIRERRKKI